MMELLQQLFLRPQALFGAVLVGVPIIIYLINRQKYRRRKWAAMEFVLRAMKRNRKRIQLQNLLLLLIRTAIILFLVLAMARPVLRRGPLAVAPDRDQNWLLAVDTSFSMGFEEGGKSHFDQARETISQMLDGFMKVGDRVALLALGDRTRVLVEPAPVNAATKERLRRELDQLALSTAAVDVGASFAAIDELCERFVSAVGDPEPKRVVVFSDFQRKDWLDGAAPRDGTVATTAEKIQREGGEFAFARMGYSDHPLNLAITDLTATPPVLARDVWVEFRATVRNFGIEDAAAVDVSIRVDPELEASVQEPQLGSVVQVPAGGARTVSLAYRFDEPGHHTVVAELRSDGLVIDNRRHLVVRVAESVRVLLVDGEPSADPLERETFYLDVALQPEDDALGPGSGRFTPFEPEYLPFDRLSDVTLSDYAVVVTANVPDFASDEAERLEKFVAEGGALIAFLGDAVRPEAYNALFGGDGDALLPVQLTEVRGDPRYPVLMQVADETHPLGRYFSERKELTQLALIPFSRYYLTQPIDASPAGVRVPFRFNDLQSSAAVFDNGYGKGRALWVMSSADEEWNEFPKMWDFVVFLYESMSYLVRFGASSLNLGTGDEFEKRYESGDYASEVLLTSPQEGGDELETARTIRKDMREIDGGRRFEITHDATGAPGLYKLDLLRPNRPEPDSVEYFAVNVNVAESELRPMIEEDFRTAFESLRFETFDPVASLRRARAEQGLSRGREFWQTCLFVVLALLLVESVLACVLGRRGR